MQPILMRRYLVPALLLAVLLVLQAQLWLGRGSLPRVWGLERELSDLQQTNRDAELSNAELSNEVRDLQTGLDMVEEHARQELGLVKPNEVFIQFTPAANATPPASKSPPKR